MEQEGYTVGNVARRLKRTGISRGVPKEIDERDMLKLIAASKTWGRHCKRNYALLLFLADTGVRVAGLCGLRVEDVDLSRKQARVIEKGCKSRVVFFGKATTEALTVWLYDRPGDLSTVFGLVPQGVRMVLRHLAKFAGVTGRVNPHSWRHAFAKRTMMQGGDVAFLSALLGHSSIAVTRDAYLIFRTEELQVEHSRHSMIDAKLLS